MKKKTLHKWRQSLNYENLLAVSSSFLKRRRKVKASEICEYKHILTLKKE